MPTTKEAAKKRRSYAWMIAQIMEEKERAARQRIKEIDVENAKLKPIYETYLKLYAQHIKPLEKDVELYWNNLHEKRKAEHFLQGQDEHRKEEERRARENPPSMGRVAGTRQITLSPQVQRLPYAGPNAVGHPPKKPHLDKALTADDAKEVMERLKALDPTTFAKLLKEAQGK